MAVFSYSEIRRNLDEPATLAGAPKASGEEKIREYLSIEARKRTLPEVAAICVGSPNGGKLLPFVVPERLSWADKILGE